MGQARDWKASAGYRTDRRRPSCYTRIPVPGLRPARSGGQWPRCWWATRPCGSDNKRSGNKTRLQATDDSSRRLNNLLVQRGLVSESQVETLATLASFPSPCASKASWRVGLWPITNRHLLFSRCYLGCGTPKLSGAAATIKDAPSKGRFSAACSDVVVHLLNHLHPPFELA